MNTLKFEPRDCTRTRELLDAYLDGELLVETNREILKHVERCDACAAELDDRSRLRSAVRTAARTESAPSELRDLILGSVRAPAQVEPRTSGSRRWLAVAAAVVLLAGGGLVAMRAWRGADRGATVERALAADASILKIGLGDHAHCALQRTLPDVPPTVEALRAAMGPDYEGLVDTLAARMPPGFKMLVAHTCSFQSRPFVHVICRSDETILSIVVTRKSGEAFEPAGVFAVLEGSGVPVYRGSMQGMEIDGIETRDHLAFVVSGLTPERNFQLAASIIPSVDTYLRAVEA